MCQILFVHAQPCAPLSACQCVRYWRYTHSLVHPCQAANVSDIGGRHTALCTPVRLPMCQILAVHTQPCAPLSGCQCVRYWRHTHILVHPCQPTNVSDIGGTHTALCTPVSLPMCQILAVYTRPCTPLSGCQCVRYWRYTHSPVHPCQAANVLAAITFPCLNTYGQPHAISGRSFSIKRLYPSLLQSKNIK